MKYRSWSLDHELFDHGLYDHGLFDHELSDQTLMIDRINYFRYMIMIEMFDREFHDRHGWSWIPWGTILLQLYGFSSGVFSRVFGVFSWGSGVFCRPANLRDQKWMYHFSPGSSAPRPSWMVSKTDHNRPTPLFSFTKMKNKCQYIYISIYLCIYRNTDSSTYPYIYICLQLHLLMFVYFQTHSKCFFLITDYINTAIAI